MLLEPQVFRNRPKFFFGSFNQTKFEAAISRHVTFVQDNHSRSVKNVLRGLHYQILQPQGKLKRVVQGEVFDVAIDIRQSSPTFGQWVGEILSAENKRPMWVPEGFAHGFVVLSIPRSASTKLPATTRRSTNAASPGTIRPSQSNGPSPASLFYPPKTRKANPLLRRGISHDPHSLECSPSAAWRTFPSQSTPYQPRHLGICLYAQGVSHTRGVGLVAAGKYKCLRFFVRFLKESLVISRGPSRGDHVAPTSNLSMHLQ
jgi:dTDP-4-dehydrorhamnose 3,5-epimerase